MRNSLLAALCGLGLSAPALAQPLTAVLRLNERVPMATLAQNVLDPASPRFHKFYTPQEIRALAGPTDAEYQSLVTTLKANGLEVVGASTTRLFVTVRAEHTAFERTFATRFTALGAKARAIASPALIPLGLQGLVASVSGLDTTRHSKPHLAKRPKDDPGGGVGLDTIRSLYGFTDLYSRGLSGAGQHIAVATYDDFNLDEVNAYYQKQGLSPAPQVDKVQFNGAPQANADSAIETEVDAEFSGALAPGAQIHVFSSATNDDPGELQMFTAILDDNRAKVVNYSWGDCEANLSAQHKTDMDPVFQRAVAQGVNIMVASGDDGSGCTNAAGDNTDPMPDWPAAHGSVVAVGGTSIDTSASTLAQTAWTGSGGGISTLWSLPDYQQRLGSPYTMRSYPDVSFNADPDSGQAAWVSEDGTSPADYLVVGGTSIAAPQWSGFLALVGEARATAGKDPVGYLNPILYSMADNDRGAVLSDVSDGSNGKYTAAAGWDAVTGYGSMVAAPLLDYLVGQ